MANTSNSERWYFTKEQLESTPSRKYGFDAYKELQYRQQAANFIQDMGQRLQVSQLCINTAIVYMHRFYVFHSFTNFPWYQMAAAALFLAAKVEEQPRKLEYVIRVANICRNPRDRSFDINSERYAAQSQDLVFNENVLLQTLGFDVAIDHPHTYVVRCCHLVRASKDLAQTSYFMASNSLHLTTMCIQYKPTVVACFCILLACKWSNWEIPLSNEKKEWYTYVDPTVTAELLQQLTNEFLVIFENCPSRLKEKIGPKPESSVSPLDQDSKGGSLRSLEYKGDDHHKHRSTRPPDAASSSHRTQEQREREYKERKEKERIAHMSGITLNHQSHHHRPERPPGDPTKMKQHSRQPPSGMPYPGSNRNEPRDILREAAKDSPFGIPTVRDPNREHGKELLAARSDKEVPKRDAMLGKPGLQTDANITNYSDVRHNLKDPNRPRTDLNKSASKAELMRRYEDQKPPHVKTETDVIRKHLTSSFDKNSTHHKTSSSSSTSHKSKSPFSLDSNKSVPKATIAPVKPQFNGNVNGSYDNKLPVSHEATDIKIKTEPVTMKEEIPTPAVIKRPSLFSPDQTPDHPQLPIKLEVKAEPLTPNLSVLSPITSPPSVPSMRNRNYSSSSEPELRPTMKKIDQVEGFENLMRDSTIGMSGLSSSSDTMQCSASEQSEGICKTDISTEIKETSMSQVVNGLETNPSIISDLLKGVGTTSHLPGVAASTSIKPEITEAPSECAALVTPTPHQEKEHRHKSKKKKDKHKHKDKGRSKEEKEEKKRKHKDKNREKHKHKESIEEPTPQISEPIKIKIQKDKIQQVIPVNQLKIKIPKDKIRTESIGNPMLLQSSSGGLKIKIPKEIITNCNQSGMTSLDMSLSGSSSSRKRDRDRSLSGGDAPASKQTKSSHRESKQNGRHSYTKVSETPPSSSVASTDQVDSSISTIKSDESNVSLNEGSVINRNNAPSEKNNNTLKNEVTCELMPSTPKDVTSTVEVLSPKLLSPISPSCLENFNPPKKLSPIPVSPLTENTINNTGRSVPVSINKDFLDIFNIIDREIGGVASATSPGHPSDRLEIKNLSIPSLQSLNVSLPPTNKPPPHYASVAQREAQLPNYPPPLYNSQVFHTPYTNVSAATFQKSFSRAQRNSNHPRHPPPSYPGRSQNASVPMHVDNNLHYAMSQMAAYNAYSVAPPTLPNVNLPPPSYGMYQPFYGNYFDIYQQQLATYSGTVGQPPLPTDAPPSHEAPPPPPPE